jgi:hypothetical protein
MVEQYCSLYTANVDCGHGARGSTVVCSLRSRREADRRVRCRRCEFLIRAKGGADRKCGVGKGTVRWGGGAVKGC